MFELKIALSYLLPRKKSLSTALVSFISVSVISVVVWLVLIFLSVTGGIERTWLKKMTSLHAPIRLSPTDLYYSSYYYLADSISAQSDYRLKTIGEKALAPKSDPHSKESDMQVPLYWKQPEKTSEGTLLDPVKGAIETLKELNTPFQDYEISGALLKLSLQRQNDPSLTQTTLSQMSYLLSLMQENPHFANLLLPPSNEDLNALLKRASNDLTLYETLKKRAGIQKIFITTFPPSFFQKTDTLTAYANPSHSNEVWIPLHKEDKPTDADLQIGYLTSSDRGLTWQDNTGKSISSPLLLLQKPLILNARLEENQTVFVEGVLQDKKIHHAISSDWVSVYEANPQIRFDQQPDLLPPWAIQIRNTVHLPSWQQYRPVLLPQSYRDMGFVVGDEGALLFSSATAASVQEQKIAIRIAGFYDPGLFAMGARCLIVPNDVTRTIHAASQTFSPDGTPTNGIFVWNKLENVKQLQQEIQKRLEAKNISSYWKVSTYKDFEFSKELFQQFKSDRTLFLLIAILILIVACCNVISLLILLVNDKKREIAILQAMGASKRSLAAIFGFCGFTMGALSSILGTIAALLTLKHLDTLVSFLGTLQGHTAFQPAFFGKELPNQLSTDALTFVLIATPLLSLLAGLLPALRATKIHPSYALRQE